MSNTAPYLAAQERLDRVVELSRLAFDAASGMVHSFGRYRVSVERSSELIGHAMVATALAEMLIVLAPAEAEHWRNQAAAFANSCPPGRAG